MNDKVTATARVQIVVEIDCTQPWGPDAKLPEVYKTAAREALDRLRAQFVDADETGFPVLQDDWRLRKSVERIKEGVRKVTPLR